MRKTLLFLSTGGKRQPAAFVSAPFHPKGPSKCPAGVSAQGVAAVGMLIRTSAQQQKSAAFFFKVCTWSFMPKDLVLFKVHPV